MENFLDLGIHPEINNTLKHNGIVKPTPIQEQAIPVLLKGKDLIAQSQTGTGKTLTFLLPILEKVDPKKEHIQALIITPTRELAIQITNEVKWLIKNREEVKVLAVYGGQDVDRQMKKLEGPRHIVIATPGRLLDHLRRKTISLSKVSTLVLDEADEIIARGFLEEVVDIIRVIPSSRQTMLFSATMPDQVKALATHYMKNPEDIRVKGTQVTLEEIKQVVVEVSEPKKQAKLFELINEYRPYLALVFCRTKQRVTALNTALLQNGFDSDELHGDLSQNKREQVMKRFREAKFQILVCTDLAARGLDVEGVTHVFNYDIPNDTESYIHRIGRTGRAGQEGMAITLVSNEEIGQLEIIERGIKSALNTLSGEKRAIRKTPDRNETDRKKHGDEKANKRAGSKRTEIKKKRDRHETKDTQRKKSKFSTKDKPGQRAKKQGKG